MAGLIPAPDLDLRNEELLAAEMIARVSGGASPALLRSKITVLEELIKLVEAGGLEPAACPELTNADPASSHTVLLETIGWHLGQFARRINTVPIQNQIQFFNLLGIELREATFATTTLEFTISPHAGSTQIPAGTHVSSEDGAYVFTLDQTVQIPSGETTDQGPATRTIAGNTLLSPGVLTKMVDVVAFVTAVTNPNAIDSGLDAETVEFAIARARRYLRRGERLVSSKDVEDAILDEILLGNGIVRAFPFVINGAFGSPQSPGHTSVIVATRTGDIISSDKKKEISVLLGQIIGNQRIYVLDPVTVDFDVEANVRLATAAPQGATLAAIETNLRTFYSPVQGNFGRPISRSEIIAVIEGTPGVDRIFTAPGEPILESPLVDVKLQFFEFPKLLTVTIHVV